MNDLQFSESVDGEISRVIIKEKLASFYDTKDAYKNNLNRELGKSIMTAYGKKVGIFYYLKGTPPKGYAIYKSETNRIMFINSHGKLFGTLSKVFDIIEAS